MVYAQVRSLLARHGAIWNLPVETPIIQRLIGLGGAGGRRVLEQPAFVGYQLVGELLSALLAVMGQATGANAGAALLRRVRACVKNRAQGPLQVSELALMVGVTSEHLARVFRRVLGTTPRQFRETSAATPVL